MSPAGKRAVIVLIVIPLLLAAANWFFTKTQVDQLRTQQQAACAVDADVGSVPLQSSPKPQKLGVSLVVDFRAQFRKLDCPGQLPVPPGLARWAAYYHLDPR